MLEKVLKTVRDYNMIEDGDVIVLGLSGGVDSMALLHILLELRAYYDFEILLAHVNHGVRGEFARRDQEFTENIANGLGLDFFTKNIDMNKYAKDHGISAEEAGRLLRYEFFNQVLEPYPGGKIAVAHNLNDQAETLLMRFFRGTGIDGLRGIEHRVANIIRPILDIGRQELESYIEENSIEITQDHTNFQPIYTRNKLRLELLPYIEENFNPNIVSTLERTAGLASMDSAFLEKMAEESYNKVVKSQEQDRVSLSRPKFTRLDMSMKYRLIRRAILHINSSLQGVGEVHLSSVVKLFDQGETGKLLDLPNDIVCRISYDDLWVEKRNSQKNINYEYVFQDNVIMDIMGHKFKSKIMDYQAYIDEGKENQTVYLDYDKLVGSPRLRNRRNGDRFVPHGMKGSKKIKDYFIDEKVPRQIRDQIPLLVDDENIVWVVGYRISDLYKVTKNTSRILRIGYEKA